MTFKSGLNSVFVDLLLIGISLLVDPVVVAAVVVEDGDGDANAGEPWGNTGDNEDGLLDLEPAADIDPDLDVFCVLLAWLARDSSSSCFNSFNCSSLLYWLKSIPNLDKSEMTLNWAGAGSTYSDAKAKDETSSFFGSLWKLLKFAKLLVTFKWVSVSEYAAPSIWSCDFDF